MTDKKILTATDLPELPGYMTVQAAADLFGFAKASIFYKIYEQQVFKHVYRIGSVEETKRPVVVLLESEVRQVKAREDAEAAQIPYHMRINAWNKRVKDWGRATNWRATEINIQGQPHRA